MVMIEWAYCLITYMVDISVSVVNLLLGQSLLYGPLLMGTLSIHPRGRSKPSFCDWPLSSIILVHSSTHALRLHLYEQPPSFNGQNVCAVFDRWTQCSQFFGMVTSFTPTKLRKLSDRTNQGLLYSRLLLSINRHLEQTRVIPCGR